MNGPLVVAGGVLVFGGLLALALAVGCEIGRRQQRRSSGGFIPERGTMVMSTRMADDYDPPSGRLGDQRIVSTAMIPPPAAEPPPPPPPPGGWCCR